MVETMTDTKEMITIPKSEYKRLLEKYDWLLCLEACGVNNWQGIDDVIEMFNELNG